MDEQNKCVMPDYEAECRKLWEQKEKMAQEMKAMQHHFENREREHRQEAAIMNAKLEMVYLIFGGRHYG